MKKHSKPERNKVENQTGIGFFHSIAFVGNQITVIRIQQTRD
jgi:hypothetical protein